MKNDFSVECWFFNQSITARIVINDFQVYREYHPIILSDISPVDLRNYYFISGYDGNLELNRPPENEFTAILMKELANAIELQVNTDEQIRVIGRQSYGSHLAGGSPSAAA
jgi:hypothetical protein